MMQAATKCLPLVGAESFWGCRRRSTGTGGVSPHPVFLREARVTRGRLASSPRLEAPIGVLP
jgi:hypothetical protein